MIRISSLKLAADTYLEETPKGDSNAEMISYRLDNFFNVLREIVFPSDYYHLFISPTYI